MGLRAVALVPSRGDMSDYKIVDIPYSFSITEAELLQLEKEGKQQVAFAKWQLQYRAKMLSMVFFDGAGNGYMVTEQFIQGCIDRERQMRIDMGLLPGKPTMMKVFK